MQEKSALKAAAIRALFDLSIAHIDIEIGEHAPARITLLHILNDVLAERFAVVNIERNDDIKMYVFFSVVGVKTVHLNDRPCAP